MIKIESKALDFPWATADPFLFCVHHLDKYPHGNENMEPKADLSGRRIGNDFIIKDGWRMYHGSKIPGFPYHPHRGFETITICRQGYVDHSDSIGGAGRFSAGDVQWMTAGKGILHSEMFPMLHESENNTLEIFQIWLNLPRKDKMVEPHFKMLWNEEMPIIHHKDVNGNTATIQLIAGTYQENQALSPPPHSWASEPENNVRIMVVELDPHTSWVLPAVDINTSRNIYLFQGDGVTIDQEKLLVNHRATGNAEKETIIHSGHQKNALLILEARPINEPVAQYGPFVMNSSAEIQQAFQEYRETNFGGWPWPQQEQVHDKNRGRFALHANGHLEEK